METVTLLMQWCGPHLRSIRWDDRAEVSVVRDVAHHTDGALNGEQALGVRGFTSEVLEASGVTRGISGPGDLRSWIDVLGQTCDPFLNHLKLHKLDQS